jgi:hypothetical protein
MSYGCGACVNCILVQEMIDSLLCERDVEDDAPPAPPAP